MPPIATFNQGLKMAIEIDRATAPSGTGTTGSGWWLGGKWHDIVTDGLPDIQDRQAVIFPTGHAGKRQMNQQAPVQGRQWSDGTFSAPVVADFLGLLLYGALGTASTNEVPSTDASVLSQEPLNSDPKSLVMSNQPSDSGAVLRFEVIHNDEFDSGTISVCGVDSYGNGASELVTIGNSGLFYSRTSWSAIGASSLAVSGLSDASLTITGVKYWEHTFQTASSAPTFAIERIGVPTAGCAASKAHMHVGMVLQEMTMNTPAADREGLFMVDATFEGDPTATCNATAVNEASPLRIWPAWTLKVTKDNSDWNKATDLTMTIGAGGRNYRAAAGVRNPQGTFHGGQEATGNFTILVDDEDEFNRWLGASKLTLRASWDTDWKLTSSVNQNLGASMVVYLENVAGAEDDGAYTISSDFRTVVDADFGMVKFTLQNGVPGNAYGTGVN